MAKLSREDVLKLARLSRLHLSNDEIEQFITEISSVLEYVDQLGSVNLDEYEPTYQVTGLTNVMRRDEIVEYGASPKELLKNAPATEAGHLKVKRMLS